MSQYVSWITAQDTIVALATAPGPGSVSIIRLSGPNARAYAQKLCPIDLNTLEANRFSYTKIFTLEGELVDQVIILNFTCPKSFTGEDVIEIQCHAGPFASKQILDLCIQVGARLAEPGEFSYRAFRNQKIDLCQAESLCNLISAKSEFAHNSAKEQLEGILSITIKKIQANITDIIAVLEAMIDYPEEGINYPSNEQLQKDLENIIQEIKPLIASFKEGQRLSDALKVGLIGRTNVGKSSLLNLLLMKERAIVTNQAGTTRDHIEEEIELENRRFRFIDTAGIRKTKDKVEAIGIERSKLIMQEADLVLFVIDSNQELHEDESAILGALKKENTLIVYNKCDLKQMQAPTKNFDCIQLSTMNKQGLSNLKKWLLHQTEPTKEALFITKERHFIALKETIKHLTQAQKNGPHAPAEIIAIDLRQSLESLCQIIGQNVSENILSSIFKNFCVGK